MLRRSKRIAARQAEISNKSEGDITEQLPSVSGLPRTSRKKKAIVCSVVQEKEVSMAASNNSGSELGQMEESEKAD